MQPDINQMMRSVQKAQQELLKAQDELAKATVEGSAGGGAVKVVCAGNFQFQAIKIQAEAVDVNDMGMLEDLILTAIQRRHKESSRNGREENGQFNERRQPSTRSRVLIRSSQCTLPRHWRG
jgi:DNA-binding YbaB/EbfC family protein